MEINENVVGFDELVGEDLVRAFAKQEHALLKANPSKDELEDVIKTLYRISCGADTRIIVYQAVAEACNYHELVTLDDVLTHWFTRLMDLTGFDDVTLFGLLEKYRGGLNGN